MLTISDKIEHLKNSPSQQHQFLLVKDMIKDGKYEEALLELLIERRIVNIDTLSYLDSIVFEFLSNSKNFKIKQALDRCFSNGLVDLCSISMMEYSNLQKVLMTKNYKEADKLTHNKLCSLAGLHNQRDWLYFTDIAFLSCEDLILIDMLWQVYSRYKFGFSKQRQIWLSNNQNWEKFWHQIGWKHNGIPIRYPDEFIWNMNAPSGHLPLFNQLRGVQVLSSLFSHEAWIK